jgi:hypothetical protein
MFPRLVWLGYGWCGIGAHPQKYPHARVAARERHRTLVDRAPLRGFEAGADALDGGGRLRTSLDGSPGRVR